LSFLDGATPVSARLAAATPATRVKPWLHVLRNVVLISGIPLLTIVNAAVGLLIPVLLSPVDFGRYAVIVTLFQYGLIFDLGLAQVIDRHVPGLIASGAASQRETLISHVLWTRLAIAAAVIAGGAAVIFGLEAVGDLPYSGTSCLLSLAAGVLFMVSLGPASVLRASSERWAFAFVSIVLMLVLAVGRPAGLALGGIDGCFFSLVIGYAILACIVQARMPLHVRDRPSGLASLSLILQGLPLFLVSFAWAFYMTANRWVVSLMTGDLQVGQFAFGSNVVALLVGAIASLSQFYYPRIVMHWSAGLPFCVSHRLRRELCLMLLAVTAAACLGAMVGPALVRIIYPSFTEAIPVLLKLLLAIPVLSLAAWLMPIALSTTSAPWLDGLVVYPVALSLLLAITRIGCSAGGISGAAWGLIASAVPLFGLQLLTLWRLRVLRTSDAALIFGAGAAATLTLVAITLR
jgi:O-antigen/teichoic acid export membrane protein